MGEHYVAANLEKKEYLENNTLNLSNKMAGILDVPFSSLLVWLLMVGQDLYNLKGEKFEAKYRGSWAKNRIILVGGDGPEEELQDNILENNIYVDITLNVMEELIKSGLVTPNLGEKGLIDEDNKFIMESERRFEYANNMRNK